MEHQELTQEEEVYYANHAWIDVCDDCGNWTAIHNNRDGSNFLTWTMNGQLLCQKCSE